VLYVREMDMRVLIVRLKMRFSSNIACEDLALARTKNGIWHNWEVVCLTKQICSEVIS
jgi:hypothetical protein